VVHNSPRIAQFAPKLNKARHAFGLQIAGSERLKERPGNDPVRQAIVSIQGT
jgi:hypothetical protein